jgi:hypothetical protein
MNLSKSETWLVVILSAITCLALLVAIFMLSRVPDDHNQLLDAVRANGTRLETLEAMKVPATARRFTADDGDALLRCLRIPYSERDPCLEAIRNRIRDRP